MPVHTCVAECAWNVAYNYKPRGAFKKKIEKIVGILFLCVWMYLWWSLCTLYLHAFQVRVIVGDSGLCCSTCVTYFER